MKNQHNNINYDDDDEEVKGDEPTQTKQSDDNLQKLEYIPIENLIKKDWIFIPIMPVIRYARQNYNAYSYSTYS